MGDDGDSLRLRQTRDEIAKRGATSSISEAADNVEIDNLDLSRATPIDGGLDVGRALAVYG